MSEYRRPFPGVHPLQRICKAWLAKIKNAKKAKQGWQDIADQCMSFYSGTFDFMWKDEYQKKFFKGGEGRLNPKFHITIQKAFELVAIYGPALYARNPHRQVLPRDRLEVLPEYFSDPMNPMGGDALYQQASMMQEQEVVANKVRADLLSRYLNYTPNETPAGGLARHSMMALDEALIKGRGMLVTEPYYYPGSDRMVVGSFYKTVNDLFIDPDAEQVETAQWIAIKYCHPTWKIERDFKLPKGCLAGYGSAESSERQSERETGDFPERDKSIGTSNDLLVYWKVFSKMGIGSRLSGDKEDRATNPEMASALDDTLGDHVYLCVSEDIPFPLNCFSEDFLKMGDEEISECFDWPVPFWKDDRWPVSLLDFYWKPGSVWPLAPLAPALGILIAINILMAHMVHRTWSSSRDFWGVKQAAAAELEKALLTGEDQCIIKFSQELGEKIQDVVTVLQQPQANGDVWTIISQLFQIFERLTGLSELAYGMATRQMRSAEEANKMFGAMSVRPDHMGKQVEAWMTEAARREGLAARWFLQPQDLDFALGQPAGMLWQKYVIDDDPDKVLREVEYRIEAGSTRKPNKDKEIEDCTEAMQFLLPMLQDYAKTTGDSEPVNAFLDMYEKAKEVDLSTMKLGDYIDPQKLQAMAMAEVQMQQQQMQQEMMAQQAKQQMLPGMGPEQMPPEQQMPPGAAA